MKIGGGNIDEVEKTKFIGKIIDNKSTGKSMSHIVFEKSYGMLVWL